jgi:adenine-specific DNA-methyltransferase
VPVRKLGVVYTPASVVRPMVRKVLAPFSPSELATLRICDFSVGEGAFVVELIAQLTEALSRAGVRDARTTAARCVHGADIDARAIEHARALTGCPNLVVADALTHAWGQFDVVVGNPPYIRQEQLATKLAGWQTATGVADLYVYFFELAHRILRPGGRYCLITPNKWLTVEYGRALRNFLSQQRSVEGVVDVARLPVFGDADAFPCITWGTLGGKAKPRGHRATGGEVDAALAAPGVEIELGGDPWHIDDPAARALIDRLAARWPTLGEALPDKPARGVVTGCNRAFVVDAATRARLDDDLVRPFLKGRDIRRWRCPPSDRFVLLVDRGTDLAQHGSIAAHLAPFRDELQPKPDRGDGVGRKPGNYQWWELQDPVGALAASSEPRLVYQDIQTGPACALIPGGVVPDTTVWILPSQDRYLLAVLNSSIYGWYAQQRFPPALNGSVRPKLAYLRQLPLATPSPAARAAIERLVEDRLQRDDAELDRAIDAAVLEVYALTEDERALLR